MPSTTVLQNVFTFAQYEEAVPASPRGWWAGNSARHCRGKKVRFNLDLNLNWPRHCRGEINFFFVQFHRFTVWEESPQKSASNNSGWNESGSEFFISIFAFTWFSDEVLVFTWFAGNIFSFHLIRRRFSFVFTWFARKVFSFYLIRRRRTRDILWIFNLAWLQDQTDPQLWNLQ